MKKTKTKKYRNTDLQYNTSEVLVPSLILLAFTLFIILGVSGVLGKLLNKPQEYDIDSLLWEQSFLEAEKEKVGVSFNTINTSRTEYDTLQNEGLTFVKDEYGINEADIQVDVNTVVDEKLYIDGVDSTNIASDSTVVDTEMRETGPIYFNDALMLRYITEDGHMRVVMILFSPDKKIFRATKQSDLVKIAYDIGRVFEIQTDDIDEGLIEELLRGKNEQLIPENDYLMGLADSTMELLKTQSNNNVREAERKAIKYYTVEGKQTVYGSRKDIQIEEDSKVSLKYIVAGKSNIDKATKDRIYMQLNITHPSLGVEDTMAYIILKLNSNLRVFDIDIL